MIGRCTFLVVLALMPWPGAGTAARLAPVAPRLALSAPFVAPGGSLTVTVSAEPGAVVTLVTSSQPAEVDRGAEGLQFYRTGSETPAGSGTVPASGLLVFTLAVPAGAAEGTVFQAQADSRSGGQRRLGNALPFRVQAAPPAGARRTAAVAATPDGALAYVADLRSGTLTQLDAQRDVVLAQLPVGTGAGDLPHRPLRLAIDPEGRHLFVVNPAASVLTVLHAPSGALVAQVPVPRGSRGIGFDFRDGRRRVYLANEVRNAVLAFDEAPSGTFTAAGTLPLRGSAPGPLAVLPDGRLAVGVRAEGGVEFLDPPLGPRASQALVPIGGLPLDLAWSGSDLLVPTFVVVGEDRVPGHHRVLRLDAASGQVTGSLLDDQGTDYADIVARATPSGLQVAVNASGTGTLLLDTGGAAPQRLRLSGGYPDATPQGLAAVGAGKLYVVDLLRDSVRTVTVDAAGIPVVQGELALGWSGRVRVPFSGDLTPAEDGEWLFRSVTALGGTAYAPNPLTCHTCHTDAASDNARRHDFQPPALWVAAVTAPFFWDGSVPTLERLVAGALRLHNHTGAPPPPRALESLQTYVQSLRAPTSPFLAASGALTPDQREGKALFEGAAGCTACHAGPALIPPAGAPLTLEAGIGTGLVPANVPSLRGLWATAPYLNQGQAATLADVLTANPADVHGQLAAPLTAAQRRKLVEYLKTL